MESAGPLFWLKGRRRENTRQWFVCCILTVLTKSYAREQATSNKAITHACSLTADVVEDAQRDSAGLEPGSSPKRRQRICCATFFWCEIRISVFEDYRKHGCWLVVVKILLMILLHHPFPAMETHVLASCNACTLSKICRRVSASHFLSDA